MNDDQEFEGFFDTLNEAVTKLYGRDGVPSITLAFGGTGKLLLTPITIPAAKTGMLYMLSRALADALPAHFFGVAMDAWQASYDTDADKLGFVPPYEHPKRTECVIIVAYRRQRVPLVSSSIWEIQRGPDGKRLPPVRKEQEDPISGGRILEWSRRVLTPDFPDPELIQAARAFLPVVAGGEIIAHLPGFE